MSDSNRRPTDYETVALPTELTRHIWTATAFAPRSCYLYSGLAQVPCENPATKPWGLPGGCLALAPCGSWQERTATSNKECICENGGARNRARTCDPLLTKQPLCQLSYSSMVVTVTSSLVPSVVQLIVQAYKRSYNRLYLACKYIIPHYAPKRNNHGENLLFLRIRRERTPR